MGGSILRTRTDDLIDLGVAQGIDRGVDQERLRNIQKYMEKKMISFDEEYDYLKDIFDFPESQRESYRQKLADIKEAPKPKANKKNNKSDAPLISFEFNIKTTICKKDMTFYDSHVFFDWEESP